MPGCVVELFATAEALARYSELATRAALSAEVHVCAAGAVEALSGSVTPQGMVAACRYVDVSLGSALTAGTDLVAVAAHVREPGNAGALIRCADAAGAGAVVLAGTSVDPYNDKAVRASAGSLFHVSVVTGTAVGEAVAALHTHGFLVVAADAAGGTSLDTLADSGMLSGRVAWIFGNEAWGIPVEELATADRVVSVPIYGRAESLNVAAAAAVCLYTTAKAQRGAKGSTELSS